MGEERERERDRVGFGRLHVHGGHSACLIPLSLALIICPENMVHNMDMSRLLAVLRVNVTRSLNPNTCGALTGCERQGFRSVTIAYLH